MSSDMLNIHLIDVRSEEATGMNGTMSVSPEECFIPSEVLLAERNLHTVDNPFTAFSAV